MDVTQGGANTGLQVFIWKNDAIINNSTRINCVLRTHNRKLDFAPPLFHTQESLKENSLYRPGGTHTPPPGPRDGWRPVTPASFPAPALTAHLRQHSTEERSSTDTVFSFPMDLEIHSSVKNLRKEGDTLGRNRVFKGASLQCEVEI